MQIPQIFFIALSLSLSAGKILDYPNAGTLFSGLAAALI